VALIVFGSAIAEFSGYSLKDIWRRIQRVKPNISCVMEYPIKVENDKIFRNKRNPDVVIKNEGPIKVVSLTGKIKIYVYNTKEDKITNFIDTRCGGFNHSLSAQELEPFKEIRDSCLSVKGEDLITIYFVNVNYYQESMMELFTIQEYFFMENRKIIENNEFKKDVRYNQIIEKIKSFVPSDVDSKFMVTGAAEHTWFFESDPLVKVKKNPSGSITVATPKDQGEVPQVGYPFLDVKPEPFKDTGFYVKAQIIGDYIEAKIKFEVKNVGDRAAIITEDGFKPICTIEPSQIKYYTKHIKVGRGKNNKEPLENFIKILNTEDKMFRLRFSILYRPANDTDKLFKSTVQYEIGKNKVMPLSG
jgi:hypothetical protein